MSRARETLTSTRESSSTVDLPSGPILLTAYRSPASDSPHTSPRVVMVHGFRGDHHGLATIARFASRALPGAEILVPDLPGFGASAPRAGRHDIDGYLTFLTELLARLEITATDPVVLVGHSFGSIIAAHFAARHPQLMRGLALINAITAPALSGPQATASRLTSGYYRLGAALPERAGLALLTNPLIVRAMSQVMTTSRDPAIRAWIHDQHRLYFSAFADRRVVTEAFAASIAHTVREVEEQLTCPVLVVAGDADAIAPLPATRKFTESVPGARLLIASGVGHLVHYERPDLAGVAVADFVREIS